MSTKEEQDYSRVHLRHCYQGEYEDGCKYGDNDCPAKPLEKPKEETIEQAAEHYAHNWFNMHETNNYKALRDGFIAGAEWQAKRMYGEEDLKSAFQVGFNVGYFDEQSPSHLTFDQWFEKFKR
jgi:hypothetical protein